MNGTAATPAWARRDLAIVSIVIVVWGLNFVATKVALRSFTPFQLGALRFAFAFVPMAFVVRRPRLPARWLIAYGLTQGLGQFGLLFFALDAGMTAALASVVMQTQVFFTALLGALLLNERIVLPLRIALALAAIGLGCFAVGAMGGGGATTALGLALNLAAAAMWGASNVIARRAQQAHPGGNALAFVVWSALVPIVPFTLMSWLFDPPGTRLRLAHAGVAGWLGAAYLGWMATIVAYGLWNALLKRHPASRVAPFGLGVPVVGIAAGTGLLGETVDGAQWLGIGFVVAALLVVLFARGAKPAAPGTSR